MAVTHLGSKTLGAVHPGLKTLALPALLQYLNDLISQVASLTSQATQYAQLLATPPNPLQLLAELKQVIDTLAAQIATIAASVLPTLTAGSISFAAQLGALELKLAGIRALHSEIEAALSAGGVHAFAIDSTPATVGSELAARVAGGMPGGGLPGARIRGVLLVTEDPATFVAMQKLLLVG